ncbi:MAG: family 10 glycosylhydrolase [Proteiniphilum sp.]|jgi:uncharacterized lipoprotein YddW (UPF0748 family)|nr:family 10 glycosylhydrolase [Proteiniphilum sp.]
MNHLLRLASLILTAALISGCGASRKSAAPIPSRADGPPKREFRGVWVHTVGQTHYSRMSSAEMKHYFADMMRKFDEAGINAVIFQIRPEADAFYRSELEPWSRYLTGEQGRAPDDPSFDPLTVIIDECHKHGMEFHAWLNPYRAKNSIYSDLAESHIYWRHPERFIRYGTQLFFDPGRPENRNFICRVIRDIVKRYDVDAIHMDDYFYPYPVAGESFPDSSSFAKYAPRQGFTPAQRDDWRRNNVNLLIRQVKRTVTATKRWVRFGVSPFGIYRNRWSDPSGSDTNGLQNYDDLYADIKLWVEKGWVDYNIPQLYWEIGHRAADYTTLLQWWNDNSAGRPLIIGQDLKRSIDRNELETKIRRTREASSIHGNCYWYGYQILDNFAGVTDMLKTDIHRTKALPPAFTHMSKGTPPAVKKLKERYTRETHALTWDHKKTPSKPGSAQRFVIYRFRQGEKVDISRAENIVKITPDNIYILPYEGGKTGYTYAVTALDAFQNESKPTKIKITL